MKKKVAEPSPYVERNKKQKLFTREKAMQKQGAEGLCGELDCKARCERTSPSRASSMAGLDSEMHQESRKIEQEVEGPLWRRISSSHDNTTRVLLLCRLVKHLTLFAERSRLFHQLIQVFTALQNRIDRLVLLFCRRTTNVLQPGQN